MFILEVANTHSGCYQTFEKIIRSFSTFSRHAIKLQVISADGLAVPGYKWYKVYQKLEFSIREWQNIIGLSASTYKQVWLDIFDPFGIEICKLNREKIYGIKLQASVLDNFAIANGLSDLTDLALMINISGFDEKQIRDHISFFEEMGFSRIILQLGIQSYPTDPKDSGLSKLLVMSKLGYPLCYADHSSPSDSSKSALILTALSHGCEYAEVHIALDRANTEYDYQSSLEHDELLALDRDYNTIHSALRAPFITEAETHYLQTTVQVPIASRTLLPSQRLSQDCFLCKRVENSSEFLGSRELLQLLRSDYRIMYSVPANTPLTLSSLRKPRIGIIIACRLKSTRLEKKALAMIGEHSSIKLCYLSCVQSTLADEVVVATSTFSQDTELCEHLSSNNIPFYRGDPDNVLDRYRSIAEDLDLDIVVRVTGDCPLVSPEYIDEMIADYLDKRLDYMNYPEAPVGLAPEIFEATALNTICKEAPNPLYSEYMTWYFTNNADRFACGSHTSSRAFNNHRLTLDFPNDLEMFNQLVQALNFDPSVSYDTDGILSTLDSMPEISALNSSNELKYVADSNLIATLNQQTRL